MFNFTPLLGARSGSPASQSLLDFEGGVKILVDVGWDESFDLEKLKELERHVPTLSIILLTHPTTSHIAAFAHCCKNIPGFTRIPVYATTPVISLGRTLLQDLYESTPLASSFVPSSPLAEAAYPSSPQEEGIRILLQAPTSEEIVYYFSLIHPLKYSQPHEPLPSPFSPPLNGLTITAYSAGHTLGGTIWHIQHGLESVVYAVDWNQAKENILSGAAWLGGAGGGAAEVIEQLRRPTALVCSSRGAERVTLAGGRQKRDDTLISLIKNTIKDGGSILIPTDSSARVLELAYLLENAWRTGFANSTEENPFKNAKLYMASRSSGNTMRLARSMLEWMDESVVREFEAAGSGHPAEAVRGATANARRKEEQPKGGIPFEFKYLKFLERKSQVTRVLAAAVPKVILASDASLEWGFSHDVLQSLACNSGNLVVLTDRYARTGRQGVSRSRIVAVSLWDLWKDESQGTGTEGEGTMIVAGNGRPVEITTSQLAPLTGKDLSIYQQHLARQRQLQGALKTDGETTLETSADVVDDQSSTTSSSSEESNPEHQGKALNVSLALSHSRHKLGLSDAELGVNILLRGKATYDFDVRGKKGRDKLFPFVAKRRRGDDFGELIRPEEYLRAEERDEVEGEDMRGVNTKKGNALGQKRKWGDIGAGGPPAGRRLSNGVNKRRRYGRLQRPTERPAIGGEQATDGELDGDESEESDYEPAEPTIQGPVKAVLRKETLSVDARICHVDFSGLHDKRSLQMLIPLIRPRKLILVGGEEDETLSLAAEFRKLLATGEYSEGGGADVFTPVVGRTIDASVDTNAWFVKLSQSLVKKLQWQNVRGLSVVTVTGCLEKAGADTELDSAENVKKKQKLVRDEGAEPREQGTAVIPAKPSERVVPILDVVPVTIASATRSAARRLHVGDLRLADLRKLLQASGHTAEFRGEGILLIDGLIAVRKSATGRIEVEGTPLVTGTASRQHEAPFYTVRRKIYEGLAVVAGA